MLELIQAVAALLLIAFIGSIGIEFCAQLSKLSYGEALSMLPQHDELPEPRDRGMRVHMRHGSGSATLRLWIVESGVVMESHIYLLARFSSLKPFRISKSHCRATRELVRHRVGDEPIEQFVLTFEGAPDISINLYGRDLTEQQRRWLQDWANAASSNSTAS